MNYQIEATLGPTSSLPGLWKKMLTAGATAFRLNTSHLELTQILEWLMQLSRFSSENNNQFPVILDLQGSKWRIGEIENRILAQNQRIELICGNASSLSSQIPVPHPDFFKAALQSSRRILLNDARLILYREAAGPDWLRARVIQGGELSPHKGITYADSAFRNENLTEKDRGIFEATHEIPQIRYALSYVRDSTELTHYREIFGKGIPLIAKIERQTALEDVLAIAGLADELWLCRGDLGAELGFVAMAQAVHQFTKQVELLPVPVLMAGQLLEYMVHHQQPTRSEVCYLLDCLAAGYKGFVLSDETAIGKFPVESCQAAALFKSEEESWS